MGEKEELLEKGWIRANVMFEVVGNPKKHVEDSLKSYMENIKTDDHLKILEEYTEPAEEIDDGLFSTFCEANMLVRDLEKLTWLCYNFTPASVEIMEPTHFEFHSSKIQDWINDFLAKLHEVGNVSKQMASQKKLLVNNMNRLIKNSMLICLDSGIDTPKEMEEKIGIPYKQLKPFFEALMKEGKIELHGDQYERTNE